MAAKRDAAYYREYRRKRKEREIAEKNRKPDEFSSAASPDISEAISWIEGNLKVPTGPLAGGRFFIPTWQRDWLIKAYGENIREAGLSIARKNGKSGLIAALLCAHVVGPLARTGWRGVVGSLTGILARELRDAMTQTLDISGFEKAYQLKLSPPPGMIIGKYGARLDFLAADKATGHAIGADLAIIDEAGLLQENSRALWNAIFSSISGRDGRLWAISIQGDGPMFEEMEKRADTPSVHFQKWAADENCAIDDEEQWVKSNPGLKDRIKSFAYMRDAAARAIGSAGNESHFRAYDLNQRVDPEKETIVSVQEYMNCIEADAPGIEGEIVVGIDLGSTLSMTCAVAISLATGAILVRGAFGDEPTLSQRADRDRMGTLYHRMQKAGELRIYPGRVTPVVPFLQNFFDEVGERCSVVAIGLDRYRRAEAEQAFQKASLPKFRVFWRGQGAAAGAHGSHDVRAFQRLVRNERDGESLCLRTRGSVMLEAAIASSVIRYDGSGNPALNKAANNARIDACSAAVIAAGLSEIIKPAPLFNMHYV